MSVIWIIGGPAPDGAHDLPVELVKMPLPALASLRNDQRPRGCLCMDEALLPKLSGLPCPVWGYGFMGLDGCLHGNWSEFAQAGPPDPGGWRSEIYLCVPLSYLWDDGQKFIREQVTRLNLNVELGLDSQALDEIVPDYLTQTKELLNKATIHMPFMDLHPGAQDPKVARISVERLQQAAEVAIELKATRAVFHLGYDARLNRDGKLFVDLASQRLAPVMKQLQLAGCVPVIENVFEPDPAIILAVRQKVGEITGGQVGLCLDVGHANAFNPIGMHEWWQAFSPFLAEMHLHDNPGHDDTHEAIGRGQIDFVYLGKKVKELSGRPVFTLEMRSEEALWQSLRALNRLWGPVAGLH